MKIGDTVYVVIHALNGGILRTTVRQVFEGSSTIGVVGLSITLKETAYAVTLEEAWVKIAAIRARAKVLLQEHIDVLQRHKDLLDEPGKIVKSLRVSPMPENYKGYCGCGNSYCGESVEIAMAVAKEARRVAKEAKALAS